MKWKVEQLRQLRGYAVEWAEPGNFLLSRRNCLFRSTTLEPPFELVAGIDAPFWKRVASNSRLAQRLLRFMVTNVIPLANGEIFVTFDKSVGVVRSGKYCELKGLFRPCRVLRGACALDNAGNVFFGEYLANNERGGMRVYKYSPGSSGLESIFTFPSNSIKHIHGIYFDRFTNSLFCLTGDDDKECRITQTFDEFRTLETVGEGDETWRAVSLLFSAESLLYGMDAEFRDNHILQFDRQSREQRSLGHVSGPVYFSKQFSGEMFFTTTAENAPSQKRRMLRRFGTSMPRENARKSLNFARIGGIGRCLCSEPSTFRIQTRSRTGCISMSWVQKGTAEATESAEAKRCLKEYPFRSDQN